MTEGNSHSSGMAIGFLLGVIIGGAVALLYAPGPGKETRASLEKKYDELMARAKECREKMGHEAQP